MKVDLEFGNYLASALIGFGWALAIIGIASGSILYFFWALTCMIVATIVAYIAYFLRKAQILKAKIEKIDQSYLLGKTYAGLVTNGFDPLNGTVASIVESFSSPKIIGINVKYGKIEVFYEITEFDKVPNPLGFVLINQSLAIIFLEGSSESPLVLSKKS